nr:gpi ethanolamine phosphate transferase 2 [Quercus suber]
MTLCHSRRLTVYRVTPLPSLVVHLSQDQRCRSDCPPTADWNECFLEPAAALPSTARGARAKVRAARVVAVTHAEFQPFSASSISLSSGRHPHSPSLSSPPRHPLILHSSSCTLLLYCTPHSFTILRCFLPRKWFFHAPTDIMRMTSVPSGLGAAKVTASTRSPSPKTLVRTPNGVSARTAPSWGGAPQAPGGTSPNGDPFAVNKHKSRLSGDASDFKPNSSVAASVKPKPSPITMLARDSEADDSPVIVTSQQSTSVGQLLPDLQHPVGSRTVAYSPTRPREYYTTDLGPDVGFRGGHFVKIENIQKSKVELAFKMLNEQIYAHKVVLNDASTYDTHMICFDNLRDADAAKSDIEITDSSWLMSHISQTEFAAAKPIDEKQPSTAYFDGQVLFETIFQGLSDNFNKDAGQKVVESLAAKFGEIHAFNSVDTVSAPRWQYRIEYKSIRSSKAAITTLAIDTPAHRHEWSITAKPYTANSLVTPHVSPHKSVEVEKYISPTGRTAWTINEFGEQTMIVPARVVPPVVGTEAAVVYTPIRERWNSDPSPRTPAYDVGSDVGTPRSHSFNVGTYGRYAGNGNGGGPATITPQTVVPARIENGQDVRTTLMLRNIPNRITIWQLKGIVDRTCHGTYDFVYLRMDFAKNTNVGYAFINFIDPAYILLFVNDVLGKPWAGRSNRMAEVSYATIQGLDCLIEKFRNSAIMDEAPDYRPKLFFTIETASDDDFISIEQPFPGPNNLTKKARSQDNAGQIGLFAPRASYMTRDRHRHSQYDRGTPSQLQEDYHHFQTSPNRYTYGSSSNMAAAPAPPPFAFSGAAQPVMPSQPVYSGPQYGYNANGYAAQSTMGSSSTYTGFDGPDYGYTWAGRIVAYDQGGFPMMNLPPNARNVNHAASRLSGRMGFNQGGPGQSAQVPIRYPFVDELPKVNETDEQLSHLRLRCRPRPGTNLQPGGLHGGGCFALGFRLWIQLWLQIHAEVQPIPYILVIDADTTSSLIRDGAAIPLTAHASPPTVTMPRIKAITTGSVPSFADLIFNLDESSGGSSLAGQDTWLAQIRAKGGQLVFYGDDTWLRLFPSDNFFLRADGTSSFFVSVSRTDPVDTNVTRHVPEELGRSDWDAMILHYLGLDHIGHKTGPQGPNMLPKQTEMDGIVKMVYEAMETQSQHKDTLLVLLGDHGMNAAGNHGGSGPGETEPALLFASPKLKERSGRLRYECPTMPKDGTEFRYFDKVEQSDIVPTLAGLMQFPVPKNSLGVFIKAFEGVWSDEGRYLSFLRQNCRQMLQIVEATLGQDLFSSRLRARKEQIRNKEVPGCDNSIDIADELACLMVRAEELARTSLPEKGSDGKLHDAEAFLAFLNVAQEYLSNTASLYGIPRMVAGMAISFAALALCLYNFRTLWPSSLASSTLTVISTLYGIMMFASSYVEEEHHFWYWLVPAWITLDSAKSFAQARSVHGRYRVVTAATIMLVVHRLAVRWNQTGQKHAGADDIVHTFFPDHHILMWIMVLATYCYNGLALVQSTFADILPLELATSVAVALVVPAFVFKLNFTQADAPELVQGFASQVIQWTSRFDLILQAQIVFVPLALVTVVTSMLSIGLARSTVLIGPNAPAVRTTLPERLHYLFTLFLMTQSRATNIPLFLGMDLQRISLRVLLQQDRKSSQLKRNASISAVQLAITVLLLSHTYFFCFGGSNSISSVDLSNAYNGVGEYNIVAVGILLFSANWTGPIWWCSAAVLLTLSKPVRPPQGSRLQEGRNWVDEEREKLRKEATHVASSPETDIETDAWLTFVSCMTAYVSASLLAIMAACTVLRTHLFIWTVFSPKYLYAMAWGVGWHLLINIGLGSALRGLGQMG